MLPVAYAWLRIWIVPYEALQNVQLSMCRICKVPYAFSKHLNRADTKWENCKYPQTKWTKPVLSNHVWWSTNVVVVSWKFLVIYVMSNHVTVIYWDFHHRIRSKFTERNRYKKWRYCRKMQWQNTIMTTVTKWMLVKANVHMNGWG